MGPYLVALDAFRATPMCAGRVGGRNLNLALRGPCCTTGYGNVFTSLARRLGQRIPTQVFAVNNHVAPGCTLPICPKQTFRNLGLVVGYPVDVHQLGTRYRILYSMTETSDLPDEWKGELRHAQEVWVPTTFSRHVFREYHPRVLQVPCGYDDDLYFPKERSSEWRENFWSVVCPEAVGKRVFGTAGVMSKRKGIDVLLWAWEQAALPDAVLVIKSRETPVPFGMATNSYLIEDDWSAEKLAGFYRALDVFVLPSRGEGLALQPLEAAACGTPSIVTRASGPADYIDDRGIYGLEVRGTSPVENMKAHHASWFEPDAPLLVDMLRAFCDNAPMVEHQYRQWSASGLTDRWVAELESADRRERVYVARNG